MEKKYFTIQEVAQKFAVAPSLIRFWEKAFKGILEPSKNSKGARRYRAEDIVQLSYIYQLVKDKGYSLAGARRLLERRNIHPTITPAAVVQRLQILRDFLLQLKEEAV